MELRQLITDEKERMAVAAAWFKRVSERTVDGFTTPVLQSQLVFSEGKPYRVTAPSVNDAAAVIEEIIQF